MINENFNSLSWHDAELLEISIPRTKEDNVSIKIHWPDSLNIETIEFLNCYKFQADMHLGFAPPDSILEARCITENQELSFLKNTWEEMGLCLEKLKCYEIVTNTTNSIIKIYALDYKIY